MMDCAIEFDHVSHAYGPTWALRGFSLQIGHGQVYALTGNNGCGKSTAMRIAAGVMHPHSGRVRVLGREPNVRDLQTAYNITYLPQDASYSKSLTVRDIVSFSAHRRGIHPVVERELESMGIGGAADWLVGLLPHHIVKRMALAVTFMGSPQIILLDEPTLALDRDGCALLKNCIARIRGTATILLAVPFIGALDEVVDVVVEMDNGIVVEQRQMHNPCRSEAPCFVRAEAPAALT